ncbi:MAG: hypothetical protein BGO55_11460 [Sphingobacteriales bacterium 50-39]|nr:MAG: hypothetical protein BGO55_11460 [Sphingobacteriales bacterium 50-39]
MEFIIIFLGIVVYIFNFYLGFAQNSLIERNLYHSDRRFSFRRINSALALAKKEDQIKALQKARKIYSIYLIL